MKKAIFITLILALLFSMTACSNKENAKNNNSQDNSQNEVQGNTQGTQENGETATRIATDIRGEVEVPLNPQRIVDISGASDMLAIIGYQVVGTANSDGYDYTRFPTYLENILQGATILGYSMSDTFDIEAIIALEPDLIVISNVQEKIYDQLQAIAPTLMVNMTQVDWKVDFMHVAEVMGREEAAAAWIESYTARATEIATSIKEKFDVDSTYLSFLASYGSIYIFDDAGIGSILYDDLGLRRPENMPRQENISLPVVTMEGLAEIDADYLFAVATEEDKATLTADPVWKQMEAVKEGKVMYLPASPYFNIGYSPIGRLVFINEIESLIEQMNE